MNIKSIDKFIIHFVGSKNNEENVWLSEALTDFSNSEDYIKKLFADSFKEEEFYSFRDSNDLNSVQKFVKEIFQDSESFLQQSQNIARYLYEKNTHANAIGGELCVGYFKDCQIQDKVFDAVGIFKLENKSSILKINQKGNIFSLQHEQGIDKLDKGCLIFNTQEKNGYKISIVDNTKKNADNQYWKKDFLNVQPFKNEFQKTNQFLDLTKQFLTKHIEDTGEVNKPDQIEMLNRSVDYFKTHDAFDKQEFAKEVFSNDELIKSFADFDKAYQKENDLELSNNFAISPQAVKKKARDFKRVLKLDKNFHIYIHGNRDMIEQGVDENGRKFYKIFYEKEK